MKRREFITLVAAQQLRGRSPLKVDVIVVMSTSPARAAKQATNIIPIVVGGMADPVGDELIASPDQAGILQGILFLARN